MQESRSERRLAENEVVFRQLNRQIHEGYEETNRLAVEDSQPEFLAEPKSSDTPLHFLCECADEKCADRVVINLHDYEDIHRHNNRFTILPGHQVENLEKVVLEQPDYLVVQKFVEPPESADTLHPTSLNNS